MHQQASEEKSKECAESNSTQEGDLNRLEGFNFVEGILTLLYSMMKEWEEA